MFGLAGIFCPLTELQAGGILVRGDYIYQTLSTSQDYNKFLSDRFGVENLSIKGPSLSLVYMAFGGFGMGIEQDALETDIPFTTLNGDTASGSLSIRQSLLTFHYALPLGFDVSVGIGTGELKRTLPGYQTESITAENVELNQGNASEKTRADIAMTQVIYHVLNTLIGIDVGLRAVQSIHDIPVDDQRPRLDRKGVPKASKFYAGGVGALAGVSIIF